MQKIISCLWLLNISIIIFSCGHEKIKHVKTTSETVLQVNAVQEECNWCGTSEAPQNVSWFTKIPPKDELVEKIIISGTVFQSDRKTPAEGIIIYVHHTNVDGIYPKKGDETGNGTYHGYLRGWMKTDSLGKYEFETIRPAPYQTHGGEPAHIHYSIAGPEHPEYWLTALWFEDDPRVTEDQLRNVIRQGGFSNITQLQKDEYGVLRGIRNIVLEKFLTK